MEAIYPKMDLFMTDTVTFYDKSSLDKYGKATFSASPVTVTGRLIYERQKSRDVQGTEVVDLGRLITYGPQTSITVNHKMVVGTDTFTVNSVSGIKDENGAHHTVIRFGR